ncbi:YopX family protein [Enterococcus avium]|uniref:YopX family protein n=1 Tax=Enterococcus avium TaxID=33945 RepID=UPI00288E0C5C|nr:YopX family protein [Enterococcus avium]MDT2429226.1 YopX family protein [Enterococcus avium]
MIPKFRAWWIQDEVMTHIDTLEFLQGGIRVSDGCWHEKFLGDEVILMQSTGLKDKNGVEIFEGDVVKVSVHNGFDYLDDEVCSVQQSRFHSGLVCINPNNDMECRIFNQDVLEDYQYEVIGNIYENPELLEVES